MILMTHLTHFEPSALVNEIVAQCPATIPVFNRFGMDTCCGGGVTVKAATYRDGIELAALLEALREVGAEA